MRSIYFFSRFFAEIDSTRAALVLFYLSAYEPALAKDGRCGDPLYVVPDEVIWTVPSAPLWAAMPVRIKGLELPFLDCSQGAFLPTPCHTVLCVAGTARSSGFLIRRHAPPIS